MLIINGKKVHASKSTTVYLSRNEPHLISNASTESELLMIELYIPGNPDTVELETPKF